eukprot:TRINITY_DN368_c1_g6_i1.p2 TRINITY_DN368_c1_g6~~TRINITY_DN368_c1_g6_i1.p2  ORF type:complete len:666 (+),score=229.47 TRINITY_DN368_c1_g6_i1:111-2000(+)
MNRALFHLKKAYESSQRDDWETASRAAGHWAEFLFFLKGTAVPECLSFHAIAQALSIHSSLLSLHNDAGSEYHRLKLFLRQIGFLQRENIMNASLPHRERIRKALSISARAFHMLSIPEELVSLVSRYVGKDTRIVVLTHHSSGKGLLASVIHPQQLDPPKTASDRSESSECVMCRLPIDDATILNAVDAMKQLDSGPFDGHIDTKSLKKKKKEEEVAAKSGRPILPESSWAELWEDVRGVVDTVAEHIIREWDESIEIQRVEIMLQREEKRKMEEEVAAEVPADKKKGKAPAKAGGKGGSGGAQEEEEIPLPEKFNGRLVLITSEDLVSLPWESSPHLKRFRSVTRDLSLPILVHRLELHGKENPTLDVSTCTYVADGLGEDSSLQEWFSEKVIGDADPLKKDWSGEVGSCSVIEWQQNLMRSKVLLHWGLGKLLEGLSPSFISGMDLSGLSLFINFDQTHNDSSVRRVTKQNTQKSVRCRETEAPFSMVTLLSLAGVGGCIMNLFSPCTAIENGERLHGIVRSLLAGRDIGEVLQSLRWKSYEKAFPPPSLPQASTESSKSKGKKDEKKKDEKKKGKKDDPPPEVKKEEELVGAEKEEKQPEESLVRYPWHFTTVAFGIPAWKMETS